MTLDEKHAWMAMSLFCRDAEAATAIDGAPLDLQTWLCKHMQIWPPEFAWEDWSGYQPAIRKVCLVPMEGSV